MYLLILRAHDHGIHGHHVLPALQTAQSSQFRIIDLHHTAVTFSPNRSLNTGGTDLSVLADQIAALVKPKLCEIKGSSVFFCHRSTKENVVLSRCIGETHNSVAGNGDCVLIIALKERHSVSGISKPDPVRIAGEERLGKYHEFRTVVRCFFNEAASLINCCIKVEEYGRCLNRRCFELFFHCLPPSGCLSYYLNLCYHLSFLSSVLYNTDEDECA